MATAPDGIPASPKTVTLDANKLNSLPTDRQSKAKLETSADVVVVPKNFLPKQGTKLSNGHTVGKAIGAGLQARCTHSFSCILFAGLICNLHLAMFNYPPQAGVYELIRTDGTVDKVKVLKAKHKYALLTKMQREWEVGRRISSLKNPERAMPGFMSVGAAVCTDKGTFKGNSPQTMQTPLEVCWSHQLCILSNMCIAANYSVDMCHSHHANEAHCPA